MWIWIPILAVPVLGPAIVGWKIWDEIRRTISEDPLVWEKQIRAFEKKERKRPAPKGAVVFAGSSTIRLWGGLTRDMAPLPAVQRGIRSGGFDGAIWGEQEQRLRHFHVELNRYINGEK